MSPDRNKIPYLPERIEGLEAVATNISWSWNREARRLFSMIDEPLWHLTRHNPISVLRRIDPSRLSECARDPKFLALYDIVVEHLRRELSTEDTWFAGLYLAWAGNWHTAHWFQLKFLLVIAMSGVHGYLVGRVRDFAEDRNTHSTKFYRIINEVPTVLLIAIVILVIVKPF